MKPRAALLVSVLLCAPAHVWASKNRLSSIRSRILGLQDQLYQGLQNQEQARSNLRKIRVLMKLQREEKALGEKRLAELGKTVKELEARRSELRERVKAQQALIRKFLIAIDESIREPGSAIQLKQEELEAPRRKVLANLVDHGLKEIEALRVDLSDSDQLEAKIQEEQQQLVYLFQDLKEQESILEFNKQLQKDILRKHHQEHLAQLENYRKLKSAEAQVENMIGQFNARLELERQQETEREVSKAMMQGEFARLKGRLPKPVAGGKFVSAFGRAFDPGSHLYIFKKGVDIIAGKSSPVLAISAGKIAFSGTLPDYGRVAIIDHGDHFYSLCAHLGELLKKSGDPVRVGEPIGQTDDRGTPVYFEIRARNVAVNPLQWLSN